MLFRSEPLFFAGWAGVDLDPALPDGALLLQRQPCLAPREEPLEERVEAAVDVRHGAREGGLHLRVRLLDQGPQLADPIADVLQLLGEEIDPLGQGDVLRQGPQVVVSQCPQLALQSTQGAGEIAPSLDLPRLRGVVGILVVPELDQLPPLGLDRGQPLRRPRDLAAQGGERGGGLPFPAAKALQPEVPPTDPSPFLNGSDRKSVV